MLLHPFSFLPRGLASVVLLGCALSLPASAQVFKCVDSAGKTAYQSQPCPETTRSAEVDLRWTSSLPTMPTLRGNASMSEFRQAIVSSCVSSAGSRGNAALQRLASTQPARYRSFCECVADTALSDPEKVRDLALRNDRAGMEQLGLRAGLACAPRLQ